MKLFKHLYFRVLIGTLLGVIFGLLAPHAATQMKILGDSFISLVKMIIGPVVFCTIVLGISGSKNSKQVGRIGAKAFVYFEVVSTMALMIGLLTVNLLKPGRNFNVDLSTLDAGSVAQYTQKSHELSVIDVIKNIIPKTFFDAFTGSGDLLQILVIALLFGFALNRIGSKGTQVKSFIESVSHILFKIVNMIMELAPFGSFGAMSFTIGTYGVKSFGPMIALMSTFYLTCILFIFVVLGLIARFYVGFSVLKFVKYIREELLLVLGTSSSESALVPLMEKLESLGCSKSTVGLVVPTGYSFNLDGTNIYLTMAALFIAQALNIPLTFSDQISLLMIAILTSKGASGVTGAGFIALAATLATVPTIPVAGLALILGIDRFMSEARALTNIIGNGVATIVISKWEKELDVKTLNARLKTPLSIEELEP